jgi:hypothetical protein
MNHASSGVWLLDGFRQRLNSSGQSAVAEGLCMFPGSFVTMVRSPIANAVRVQLLTAYRRRSRGASGAECPDPAQRSGADAA